MSLQKALDALKRNDFSAARALIAGEDVVAFTPHHFLVKGLAEMAMGDWAAAQGTFAAATGRFADHPLFWLNRGVAEENVGLIDAAILSHEKCLTLNPQQAESCGNLANLYRKKKRFSEAETMARRALANGANKSGALNSLGLALGSQGKFAEADDAFRQAQQEAPDNPDIYANRANLAVDQLHFDDAWKFFAEARGIQDKPVFRHDEGLARLLSGDYRRGFELFEARLELPRALRLYPDCPRWNGESLTGKKLLILAEQGFGDVIQFSRYAQFLTGAELVWVVPSSLVRLLSGNVRGTVICESDPLPACDYYVPILSLPWILMRQEREAPLPPAGRSLPRTGCGVREGGTQQEPCLEYKNSNAVEVVSNIQSESLLPPPLPNPASSAGQAPPREGEGIPQHFPYLTPLLPQGPHRLKIGLVWAGSPTHERDHERSIKLEQLAPLFNAIDANFYAPFTGEALNEIDSPAPRGRGAGESYPVIRLDHLINDFADTAALLKQMDCLVTVDTAIAHLAGALGVKTCLLLAYCPDWRWGMTGEKTEWYPSIILIRQTEHGNWQQVIDRLIEQLPR